MNLNIKNGFIRFFGVGVGWRHKDFFLFSDRNKLGCIIIGNYSFKFLRKAYE